MWVLDAGDEFEIRCVQQEFDGVLAFNLWFWRFPPIGIPKSSIFSNFSPMIRDLRLILSSKIYHLAEKAEKYRKVKLAEIPNNENPNISPPQKYD